MFDDAPAQLPKQSAILHRAPLMCSFSDKKLGQWEFGKKATRAIYNLEINLIFIFILFFFYRQQRGC